MTSRITTALFIFVVLFGIQCLVFMLIKDKPDLNMTIQTKQFAQTQQFALRYSLNAKFATNTVLKTSRNKNFKEIENIENVLAALHANNKTRKPSVLDFQTKKQKNVKYILLWTSPTDVPFVYFGTGRDVFIKRKCAYTNCFVTSDRKYFDDYTKFDVIAFAGPEVNSMPLSDLPQKRSPHQKYVFASIESSNNYPVCLDYFNGYYNWTWTYKLDSDARWGYIVVKNRKGIVIGPNKEMHWLKKRDMRPVLFNTQRVLVKKKKFAAWFASNCGTRSDRETLVKKLNEALFRYGLKVDVFGKCGDKVCKRPKDNCHEMIRKDYLFYLAFENSISEDYVTEKLLHALHFYAIPVVYGGANYSRFMPDGIYLNAMELGVTELAARMHELTNDFDKFSEFFRWKSHYKYSKPMASPETDDYCGFCKLLNDEEKVKTISVYENFREWWNGPDDCKNWTRPHFRD